MYENVMFLEIWKQNDKYFLIIFGNFAQINTSADVMKVSVHDFSFGVNIEESWVFDDNRLGSFPSWENSCRLEISLAQKSLR
jgi:hypothetical protein